MLSQDRALHYSASRGKKIEHRPVVPFPVVGPLVQVCPQSVCSTRPQDDDQVPLTVNHTSQSNHEWQTLPRSATRNECM